MCIRDSKKAYEIIQKENINALIIIGGDGSLTGARIFAEEYDVTCIGLDVYKRQARNYKDCPLRCRCYRSRSERSVQVNHRLRKIKEREREKLLSDEGLKYRSQRPQDVEAVFGNLKNNKRFKRFHLRGFKKVEIEFALLALSLIHI